VRALLVVAVAAALFAVSATAAAPIKLKLTTSSSRPVVGEPWRYTISARSASGAPLRGRLKLQLLLGTTVVGCWKGGAMVQCSGAAAGDWISFRGKRSGILRFPAQAVGVRLTFRAIVQVQGRRARNLRAPVTVQAALAPEPTPLQS
jgi:hypothetical protein